MSAEKSNDLTGNPFSNYHYYRMLQSSSQGFSFVFKRSPVQISAWLLFFCGFMQPLQANARIASTPFSKIVRRSEPFRENGG
jgi:hypothetical protein